MEEKIVEILAELEKRRKIYLQKAKKWDFECNVTKDRKCEIWAEWYRTRAFSIDETISVIRNKLFEGGVIQWQNTKGQDT